MSRNLPKFAQIQAKAWVLFLMLLGAVTGLNAQVQSRTYQFVLRNLLAHTVPELSVQAVAQHMEAYPVFLDARERNEFEVSHLKGAIWVGYKDFELSRMPAISKDLPIVVYCSVGYRSEKIAEKLIAAGYKQAANLYGGIFEWVNQKQPLVDPLGHPTDKVHAYNKVWGSWVQVKKKRKVYH